MKIKEMMIVDVVLEDSEDSSVFVDDFDLKTFFPDEYSENLTENEFFDLAMECVDRKHGLYYSSAFAKIGQVWYYE